MWNWHFLTLLITAPFNSQLFSNYQQLAALLITKQVVGNVKEALIPFVKQKVKEWKLKKQDAKAKKELDEKEGKDKAASDKKSDKPKELDSPLMNQAEIEATMAEYEVTINNSKLCNRQNIKRNYDTNLALSKRKYECSFA